MTLLINDYIRVLYDEANSDKYEHSSISFWNYLLTKVYFTEDWFFTDREKPASPDDPLRRVDEQVRYFERGSMKTRVLCIHEGKKAGEGDSAVANVEGQAFEACATYCASSGMTHVYALTTIGTYARTWKYSSEEQEDRQFVALFGSAGLTNRAAYVDANSALAIQLDQSFRHMKQFLPSGAADQALQQPGQSRLHATGSDPSQIVPSSAGTTSDQQKEFTAAQQDGEWHWSKVHQKYYRFDKVNWIFQ
ncbi:hypothetical protein AOQ84DRAFT_388450 [Glonium stellatum]|uniref:Uncharacterized protein n=1 Tax=Glonium stellatum TaxID=574774 RepID=A0A8E2JTJ2_9PEZI|nr:hypothetical protein AOQ84DRAFT_388450 [Glonium stellatum]